jgi:hypothetical protein
MNRVDRCLRLKDLPHPPPPTLQSLQAANASRILHEANMTRSPDNLQPSDSIPAVEPLQPPADPLPNPEPAAPSLDQPDPGVFHHNPVNPEHS